MPLQLKTPEVKTIVLHEADPSGDTYVKVRQATTYENSQRAELWATASRIMRDSTGSEVELKQRISFPEVWRLEAWLTMCGCNIIREDGQELFRFSKDSSGRESWAMTQTQFEKAWGLLPPDVALEVHQAVLEVNEVWAMGSGESAAS